MVTKFEKLLDAYQSNAYPGMVDDLANHLGISADSIRRLGVGWASIVPFKKGNNFDGWWAIPERDSDAKPIGLSLRSKDDCKVMLPGSQHGMIYEVNPQHSLGERGYSSGSHNWRRTMDVGVSCPVCGKPDGCLVSSDNPMEPKAVVCIRNKSSKPLRFGYLHVLKPEGILRNATALAGNMEEEVILVEGFSDAAAAMDLGFVSVGRPSNLACMDILRDVVRGRSCVVVGENDKKADEKWPGRDGMLATFQALKGLCPKIKMVMPPSHIKDLRAWKVKYGLTKEDFLKYVAKHGESEISDCVIADDRPLTIARAYLNQCCRMANRYTVRRWEQTWYGYAGYKYSPIKEEAFRRPIYGWSHDKLLSKPGKDALHPLKADNAMLANVTGAITSEVLVDSRHMPCWINGATGPDPANLVVFSNGILDVGAYLNGDAEPLLDSTPDLFTTAALPLAFDPTATCSAWLSFLNSSLGDEVTKIDLLQEWIGYCLTSDTSYQKMMYFRGPPCSGKSLILDVLGHIMGPEQTACPSFADLTEGFAKSALMGKLVCLVGDARTPKYGDANRGLEILLNITGNDSVMINRKFKDYLEGVALTCRITIASNEMLDVPDHAGAMIRRLNFIEFNRSFAHAPDYQLPLKLKAEAQGIVLWALEGLRRLRSQGCFTVPDSSKVALMEWRIGSSPTAGFLEECVDQGEQKYEVTKKELYDAWTSWSTERRIIQVTTTKFFERIKANCPSGISDTYERGGQKFSIFRGLRLKPWASKQYLGRPN
jgi:P4 family phage/plasmid primase-like protien